MVVILLNALAGLAVLLGLAAGWRVLRRRTGPDQPTPTPTRAPRRLPPAVLEGLATAAALAAIIAVIVGKLA